VAVVALLKSVGASPKLTILIVGESLLNDGSAMVLFTIFFNALKGTKYTAGGIIWFTLAAAIGSVIFGIICGLLLVRWLRTAHRPLKESDVTMQIGMTLCCAYLTFFIAQYCLEVSGVLACCGAGAMVAWLGPPIILNHESMHNVWGMAEWTLNTMIFLLAGLIIGHRVLGKVNAMDWLYMVILYALLMAIRAVTILLLYPFIRSIGHRCTRYEAVFMSWAGLRGALGMALALIVEYDGPEDLNDETSRLFFYVGGIAAITLIVNATTSKSLLYYLGLLTTNSAEKMLVTNQIKKKLRKKMDKVVSQMTKEFSFTDKDLEEVRSSCSLLQGDDGVDMLRDTHTESLSALLADNMSYSNRPPTGAATVAGGEPESPHLSFRSGRRASATASGADNRTRTRTRSRGMSFGITNANSVAEQTTSLRLRRMSRLLSSHQRTGNMVDIELLAYIRNIFLEIVRVKYWHFIEVGKLPRLSFSAQFLLYTVEVGLDDVNTETVRKLKQQKRQPENEQNPSAAYSALNSYSKDWNCLFQEITSPAPSIEWLIFLEKHLPSGCSNRFITNPLSFLETRKEKREVYMLTSFIEAHEHAQSKIHKFLGYDEENEGEGEDSEKQENNNTENEAASNQTHTIEETQVIEESKRAVRTTFLSVDCFLFK
jgi:NhaP-type Na+/H+ or K+/H+ antiporter